MRILNVMFGRKRGGIEQASVDYAQALMQTDHEVHNLIYPGAAISEVFESLSLPLYRIHNYGQWDLIAVWKVKQLLHKLSPDVIIAHGNRAITLLKRAGGKAPLVGVCHNYHFKHLLSCDALLCITKHMQQAVQDAGFSAERTYHIPNMIHVPESLPQLKPNRHDIPVIGVMARFVKKKGVDVFLHAMANLKHSGVSFRAVIAGDGEEKDSLHALCRELDLDSQVTFVGWAEDKTAFYDACDIFCLPSLHEPFGIVLLEAMLYAKPVVTTRAEGPREIVTHEKNALITPIGDATAMASACQQLLEDKELSVELAQAAQAHVVDTYALPIVASTLSDSLDKIRKEYYV